MKTPVTILSLFLILCMEGYGQQIRYEDPVHAGIPVDAALGSPGGAELPAAAGAVPLYYFNQFLPRLNWQLPRDYSSFIMLSLMQRFTLPNNLAFLDSIRIYIENINQGKIRFRVFPDTLINFGTASFRMPNFSVSYDQILVDKSDLTMRAFNTVKMSGASVPKEFFVVAEFTVENNQNNIFILSSDSRSAPRRSTEDSRVIAVNQVGNDVQVTVLDSIFQVSGTYVYPQLYMVAFVDTATWSDTPVINTVPPTDGYTNQPWRYTIRASGVPRPYYLLISGPPTMTIANLSGEVEWTPTPSDIGDHPVTLRAINANGQQDQTFTIRVVTATPPKITSLPKTLGIVNELYTYTVTATGGPPPTYSLYTGPQGMTIEIATGKISWLPGPTNVGTYIITAVARNGVAADTQRYALRIDAAASAPRITSSPVVDATVNVPYSYQVISTGNPPPLFTLTTAPSGMSIHPNLGIVSWTPLPNQVGTHSVTIHAENRAGTNDQSFDIIVSPPPAIPSITSSPDTLAIAEQPYSYRVIASGTPPPTYSLTRMSPGMLINSTTGEITWTPARGQSGIHEVTARATNSAGFDEQSFRIHVRTVPKITSTPVLTAEVSKLYEYQATAEAVPTAQFDLAQAPGGMTVTPDGLVSWTPATGQTGTQTVILRASNSVGQDQQQFDIDVKQATAVGSPSIPGIFSLSRTYPHPVVPGRPAYVELRMASPAGVRIRVHDLLGRPIMTLKEQMYEAGRHVVSLSLSDFDGRVVPGVYLLAAQIGTRTETTLFVVSD